MRPTCMWEFMQCVFPHCGKQWILLFRLKILWRLPTLARPTARLPAPTVASVSRSWSTSLRQTRDPFRGLEHHCHWVTLFPNQRHLSTPEVACIGISKCNYAALKSCERGVQTLIQGCDELNDDWNSVNSEDVKVIYRLVKYEYGPRSRHEKMSFGGAIGCTAGAFYAERILPLYQPREKMFSEETRSRFFDIY
ncbi:unnamed protein product [Nesidiocoris tenuis]|uniref:Uncharacterized protein n=1 Tax=Nesidiocoris tenuis TaxID=355587 RepID=A0A6H5G0T9_9HEMI|nr:unnamed protein product [Nesidiocoris tenuis]